MRRDFKHGGFPSAFACIAIVVATLLRVFAVGVTLQNVPVPAASASAVFVLAKLNCEAASKPKPATTHEHEHEHCVLCLSCAQVRPDRAFPPSGFVSWPEAVRVRSGWRLYPVHTLFSSVLHGFSAARAPPAVA